MNKTTGKETLCFYLVAAGAALSAIGALCTAAIWRATGGLAVGFALFLPALLMACLGYSYPSPLNKVRCAVLMGCVVTLPALHLGLFIAVDLAGVPVVLRTISGVFQPNTIGILLTVLMGCGMLTALFAAIRVILHAFGKSMSDAERKLLVQSRATEPVETAAPVAPRNIDTAEMLAMADQEVRMSRMSVTPTEEKPVAQPVVQHIVTPAEARARMQRRHDTPSAGEGTVTVTPPADNAAASAKQPISIETASHDEDTNEIIYAANSAIDDEAPMVALAQGEQVTNADVRAEVAVTGPREADAPTDDDIYTDFAYAGAPADETDDDEGT